jgi:hypothetical protein
MESSLWCWVTVVMLPLVEIMKPRRIGLTLMAIAGYNPEEAIVSGLEWQQILPEKLHLSFLVHTRQMHRELLV